MAGFAPGTTEAEAMRCFLGWHKPRRLDVTAMLGGGKTIRQGCDRCGKSRLIVQSPYGRTIEVTRWT